MQLSDFRVLSFDCYGTLIDWETGILAALSQLFAQTDVTDESALHDFADFETQQEAATPKMLYSDLLAIVYRQLAAKWGIRTADADAQRFGASIGDWPAFPDSVDALAYLKQHYKLVILSNVDRKSFAGSNDRLQVEFDRIYTAEDIGTYKPDRKNFLYLLEHLRDLGYHSNDILHTAQSLFHDHVPATELGLATAWIDRRRDKPGSGATAAVESEVRVDFHFHSLSDLVEAHKREAAA
jgi:2-haloalkanoic acid dehalogenase type II